MYRVKFYDPEQPSKGFIQSYNRAAAAKAAVAKWNALYERDGLSYRAEYLGRRK